jgi:RNA polymerase sigma-70 factor, ECF subfamily
VADAPEKLDDTLLIQRIAQADGIALSTLYDRYARIVYAIAFRSLGSSEESEEVVLDVFAQVWRSANRYDQTKSRVDSWIFMMARSRILDRLRKHQRRVPESGNADLTEIQVAATGVTPVEAAIIEERREKVTAALIILPQEQRQLVELAYYQGLSHSEIASQTGIPLGTVKTRIRLGLSKLRSALESSGIQ